MKFLIGALLVSGTWCLLVAIRAGARVSDVDGAWRAVSGAGRGVEGRGEGMRHGFARRVRRITPRDLRQAIKRRLEMAGLDGRLEPEGVVLLHLVGALAGLLVMLVWLRSGVPTGLPGPALLLLGALAGGVAPSVAIGRTTQRRTQTLTRQFPDFLDLMSLSVSSGLAFDVALMEVAQEIQGPLGHELELVATGIALGTSREDALDRLARRVDLPELSSFVMAVNQATELGSPIGTTLRAQAEVGRIRRRQLEEERINKLPVKILLPTMLFILPPTLMVVIGPAMSDIMRALSS